MDAVTQIVDSTLLAGIIPLPKRFQNKKVEVTVTLDDDKKLDSKSHKQKIKIGFLKNLPPLPESFFEPLPEEELQLWGL